ncbi:MAG TPA: c-type cytochrome, partial [Planctomycetaceae bacterium]|nr:c-type cytochrome [Planctomycetaceae bacterium]
RVREHAIVLSEGLQDQRDAVLAKLVTMTGDADVRVQWQLAFSLGEFNGPSVVKALGQLARQADKDADLRLAILTSVGKTLTEFGVALLSDPATMNSSLARDVARMVGSTSNEEASKLLQQGIAASPDSEQVTAVAMAVGEGTMRRGVTLIQLAETMPVDSDIRKLINARLQVARNVARQSEAHLQARIRSVALLGLTGPAFSAETLSGLLSPQSPPELQQAAVKTLLSLAHKPAQEQVLAQWKGLGPAARKDAIDGLTQSRVGAALLLAGLVEGTVKTGEIDRDKQQLLMNYPQAEIRDQARKLLGGAASNRREVVAKYQPALELTGDATRGQAVHAKICMQCHRAGTTGHAVGPDLVSVQNKSPDDLLVAILDPNREAQPVFVSYTASTDDGKVYTGIIAAETAASVTLRRAEAKEDVVLRNQLEELVSNGVSLMPEGMEKDLTPQQVADVIAYIKSLSPPTTK